jgi:hypothetical protein
MKTFINSFKFDRLQVLDKNVCKLFISRNIEKVDLVTFLHTFSDIVVTYSHVF